MRWNVEVSSIDNSARGVGSGSVVIEADSWQRALQDARTQRGEDGSISGFSIELLEEGYRAVDPVARVRYTVKRAVDGPLAPPLVSSPVASAAPSAMPPRPSAALRAASVASGPPSSNGHAAAAPAPAPFGVALASAPERAVDVPVAAAPPPSSAAPLSNPRPSQAQLAYQGALPAAQLLSKREHDASERVPLTYREYVYCVAAGVNEHDAERLLRVELDRLKVSILRSRPGKFVNMAVFDVAFEGRPPVAPLATLSWKDWRGAPVIGFPRRGVVTENGPLASTPASLAPASVAAAPAFVPAPSPPASGFPPHVAPARPNPSEFPPPVVSAPPPQAPALGGSGWPPPAAPLPASFGAHAGPAFTGADPFAAVTAPLPAGVPVPSAPPAVVAAQSAIALAAPAGFPPAAVAAPSPAAASFPPPPVAPFPVPPAPASIPAARGSRPGTRTGTPRRRASGDDLIADLFESMHELHFCQDALDAGDFVLRLALDTIPSRLAIAHLYDIDRREFVVAAVLGTVGPVLLARREPESDPLLAAVMRSRRSLRLDATEDPRAQGLERYRVSGGPKSVLLSPVMKGGRYLGAIELLDPLDGVPYTANEGNALDYMGEQYGEFLALRGVVVDAERISRQPAAPYP